MKQVLHVCFLFLLIGFAHTVEAKNSIAKEWNEEVLHAIRNSRARATVHARNLYHWSILVYDCWAAYSPEPEPFFLGNELEGFHCSFKGIPQPKAKGPALKKAISFASYRFIIHRYKFSPRYARIKRSVKDVMKKKGYDISDTTTNYLTGNPAHFGNYLAKELIEYGHQDGAYEKSNYANQHYVPLNDTLNLSTRGTPGLKYPNHWQPLQITRRHDQAGNPIKATQTALSPEWGDVDPFALSDSNKTTKVRQKTGNSYQIYLDPGPPPYIDTSAPGCLDSEYKWGFCMVSIWQSHLDPADTTKWDISPGNIGGVSDNAYPEKFKNYDSFYNFYKGGGPGLGKGYDTNPVTGKPYSKQIVKRADYARILAEYWADGVSSETPPGHWYAIYNKIENDRAFVKQWNGKGDTLKDLAFDVKAYLTLGGAVHDAAVAAWSVKGYYDFVRPVSAIRWMASKGQCSDPNKMNYDSAGIPLIPGYIELVEKGDQLAGANNQNFGEIKLYTWRGHSYIQDPDVDTAGVGWILADNWWPYQKPSFVTPPFPGYVSGHSTFSRAASRVMTKMTGSPYFPGGKSNFHMEKNEFLEHENGPTSDVYLQYAKYKDASDYTSLSRIWGGIHPPADDLNGREMGLKAGNYAFKKANKWFNKQPPYIVKVTKNDSIISKADWGDTFKLTFHFSHKMDTVVDPSIKYFNGNPINEALTVNEKRWLDSSRFQVSYEIDSVKTSLKSIGIRLDSAYGRNERYQKAFAQLKPFLINMREPKVTLAKPRFSFINDGWDEKFFDVYLYFNEAMDTSIHPGINLSNNQTLTFRPDSSEWLTPEKYRMGVKVDDHDIDKDSVTLRVSALNDAAGNQLKPFDTSNLFAIRMKNPGLSEVSFNKSVLNVDDQGKTALIYQLEFSRPMDTSFLPRLAFRNSDESALVLDIEQSYWKNEKTCQVAYKVKQAIDKELYNIQPYLDYFFGQYWNPVNPDKLNEHLVLDTERPKVESITPAKAVINRNHIGIAQFELTLRYSEKMKTQEKPVIFLEGKGQTSLEEVLEYDIFASNWTDSQQFVARFNVKDSPVKVDDIQVKINFGEDRAGNNQQVEKIENAVNLDLVKPEILSLTANRYRFSGEQEEVKVYAFYNKAMDTTVEPKWGFKGEVADSIPLSIDEKQSHWMNTKVYKSKIHLASSLLAGDQIHVYQFDAKDKAGNYSDTGFYKGFFQISSSNSSQYKASKQAFKIYPNPIKIRTGDLKIETGKHYELLRLKLVTNKGRVLKSKRFKSIAKGVYQFPIDADYESGAYILKIDSQNLNRNFRIILMNN